MISFSDPSTLELRESFEANATRDRRQTKSLLETRASSVSHIIFAFKFDFWLPPMTAEATKPDDITTLSGFDCVSVCFVCEMIDE